MEYGMFQGKEMWIGIADILTGKIRETHTFEEAKKADFHTCFYFSEEQEQSHEKNEGIYFWIGNGTVELEHNNLTTLEKESLKKRIREQVSILNNEEHRNGQRQIQILYQCNEWKEFSSMKMVGLTSKPEVLYAMIGASIKAGDMEYGFEDKEKGWELFQSDYGKQQVRLELLQYGYVEIMPDLSISDRESIENYSEIYEAYKALYIQRAEEILEPLHLDRQCLIYSMADVHSDNGSEQIILAGFGKEEALRSSPVYNSLETDEECLELKVEVSSYAAGTGDMRECSQEEARLIEDNFQDVISLYDNNLIASDYYEICLEHDMEE